MDTFLLFVIALFASVGFRRIRSIERGVSSIASRAWMTQDEWHEHQLRKHHPDMWADQKIKEALKR